MNFHFEDVKRMRDEKRNSQQYQSDETPYLIKFDRRTKETRDL